MFIILYYPEVFHWIMYTFDNVRGFHQNHDAKQPGGIGCGRRLMTCLLPMGGTPMSPRSRCGRDTGQPVNTGRGPLLDNLLIRAYNRSNQCRSVKYAAKSCVNNNASVSDLAWNWKYKRARGSNPEKTNPMNTILLAEMFSGTSVGNPSSLWVGQMVSRGALFSWWTWTYDLVSQKTKRELTTQF